LGSEQCSGPFFGSRLCRSDCAFVIGRDDPAELLSICRRCCRELRINYFENDVQYVTRIQDGIRKAYLIVSRMYMRHWFLKRVLMDTRIQAHSYKRRSHALWSDVVKPIRYKAGFFSAVPTKGQTEAEPATAKELEVFRLRTFVKPWSQLNHLIHRHYLRGASTRRHSYLWPLSLVRICRDVL
jgi:hypothetical protein